jgi:hypothetical protein
MERFTITNGDVYLNVPNDPPIEDDWGYSVLVTSPELLKAARRFLSDDQIADALVEHPA